MSLTKWLILGLLLLPAAELAVFLFVASAIGFGAAALLVLATSLLGFIVLKTAGHARRSAVRSALSGARISGFELGGSLLTLAGGILLLLPGFITDALGLLLLLAPVRNWVTSTLAPAPRRAGPSQVVDLEPDEWRALPDDHDGDERRRHDPPRRDS